MEKDRGRRLKKKTEKEGKHRAKNMENKKNIFHSFTKAGKTKPEKEGKTKTCFLF